MICIVLKNNNPFYCLASEEYLLKNFDDDIFMLWQSDKTVVVGKHQNALGEVNYRYVRENAITVTRRISGGGTVYHDAGNVNFAFIKNVKSPAEISFKQFTEPVVEALAQLDIEATTSGRNDLLIKGLKISGNAEHVFKNRVLHHGTLLFNSDLENLGNSIKVIPGKYTSKAVQSNRSKVANISPFLKNEMDIEAFIDFLIGVQLKKDGAESYTISAADNEAINKLVDDKFTTWEWRWGYSPKYTFTNKVEIDGRTLEIHLEVKKGHIESANLQGNYFDAAYLAELTAALVGKQHFYETIRDVLKTDNEELIYAFF
ncbi:lipoate-protein ligase [Draconibacterium orientale]|uniref:lipoate--protein ligase n=1 Tax=Draconibacterium orientale TaxID=1168034 RepID=X5DAP9_9BACT|nr:lipoate--protein ligase [Draconibacterium orientale]AHW59858.1 lipoate--protein ligase [Draconibacterium orientale]SET76322.1 lipoate-protein ligase [Draconibacterium orientale]